MDPTLKVFLLGLRCTVLPEQGMCRILYLETTSESTNQWSSTIITSIAHQIKGSRIFSGSIILALLLVLFSGSPYSARKLGLFQENKWVWWCEFSVSHSFLVLDTLSNQAKGLLPCAASRFPEKIYDFEANTLVPLFFLFHTTLFLWEYLGYT